MPRKESAPRPLKAYREKRDFTRTPEPAGKEKRPAVRRPRDLAFCVQKHLASHLHYDLRLEHEGVLLSWAVPKGPSLDPKQKRLAMKVEDHPLEYGDFEGVIPEGYGAGIVVLWDHGTWRPQPETPDVTEALRRGELKFEIQGVKLKGSWVLVRTGGAGGDGRAWLLIKHKDEWAGPVDITAFAPRSVKTNRDFVEVLAAEDPDIWRSNRPVKGGETGKMLLEIIQKAAELKAATRPARRRPAAPSRE